MKLADYLASNGLSQSDFGKRLGVTQGMVSHWLTGRASVPLDTAIEIERESNRAVTCEELRPDVDWAYIRSSAGNVSWNPE